VVFALSRPSIAVVARRAAAWKLPLACAALAAIPDADLLLPITHRSITHSVTAVALVSIIAILVTGWVTGKVSTRIVVACTLAYASHLLLDWLNVDTNPPRGIQALWPFDDRWFISDLDLFPRIERRQPFSVETMAGNLRAAIVEILIMGPVALVAWWAGRRGRDGGGHA
jgi:inner membrane protein